MTLHSSRQRHHHRPHHHQDNLQGEDHCPNTMVMKTLPGAQQTQASHQPLSLSYRSDTHPHIIIKHSEERNSSFAVFRFIIEPTKY